MYAGLFINSLTLLGQTQNV